jgi:predicted lipoprotein with Yx(FWY)xxD motif
MRIRPIWTFPLIALATTGALFTANAVTAGSNKPAAAPYTLSNDGNNAAAASDTDATAAPAALSVQTDPALGKIVIDGKGWTLYRFDKDTVKPPASNCDGDCATTWPPVPAADDIELKGVSKAAVSKVTRKDGTEQLTLGGWPLYRYAKDTAPGDTNGQGVGGTWFASSPTGGKAGATAAQAPAATEAPAADPPVTETPAPPKAAAPAKPNWAGWTVLKAVKDPKLGWVVVDGKGWVLYRFDKDTVKPSVSNCTGACAKVWPPIKFTKKLKLTGISRSLIGNIMTKDGICQLTLGGWPLYRYSKDVNPGDTNGQGVGGTWFASTPEGKKAQAAAAPAGGAADSGAADDNSGGYGY